MLQRHDKVYYRAVHPYMLAHVGTQVPVLLSQAKQMLAFQEQFIPHLA